MNSNVYCNYVKASSYYIDLEVAIKKANKIVENINGLISALNESNGGAIAEAINDLRKFKININSVIDYYEALLKSSEANAVDYDDLLSLYKNKVGKAKLDVNYGKCNGNFVGEKNSIYSLNLYNTLRNDMFSYKVSLIKSVEIDEGSGYILVKNITLGVTGKYMQDALTPRFVFDFESERVAVFYASCMISSSCDILVNLYNYKGEIAKFIPVVRY